MMILPVAMPGDSLPMISDTTIATAWGQGVEMRDEFRLNFLTALPAALVRGLPQGPLELGV